MAPIVGEVTTAGACLVGGLIGGVGAVWAGRWAGEMDGDPRWSIAWCEVVRITALWNPGFVGETMLATIEATGQSRFVQRSKTAAPEPRTGAPHHPQG